MSSELQSGRPLHGPQQTPGAETLGHRGEQGIDSPTDPVIAGTPRYVLLDGNARIGPKMARLQQDDACTPIFGFTDKDHYERFRASSQLSLTPYPLVKRYLQSQIDLSGTELKLVVVDADGPNEPNLQAATMEDVLEAQENGNRSVAACYRLALDRDANGYTVDGVVASNLRPTSMTRQKLES